ncbi:hypothetical protein EON65_50235 [archaeon]|nr:MAG: hypothetical protein EON65_50235 [archaeon]
MAPNGQFDNLATLTSHGANLSGLCDGQESHTYLAMEDSSAQDLGVSVYLSCVIEASYRIDCVVLLV